MDFNRLENQLRFIAEIDKLKSIFRQTLLIDQTRLENAAEHSWHFAICALVLYEYADQDEVDIIRVIKMGLVHDLVEIYAGDTYSYADNAADSFELEKAAANRLFALLPEDQGAELRSLWEEFDQGETPDALFAQAIDTLQPQLNNYLTSGAMWQRHQVPSEKVYKRAERIKKGIPKLWPYWDNLLQDAIAKGYLTEGPTKR